MFCHKCGAKIPDNAAFCSSCGEKLDNKQSDKSTKIKNETKKDDSRSPLQKLVKGIKILFALGICLLLLQSCFSSGGKSDTQKVSIETQQKEYQEYMNETYSMMKTVETEWDKVSVLMTSNNVSMGQAYDVLHNAESVMDKMQDKFSQRDTPKHISDSEISDMNDKLSSWVYCHEEAIKDILKAMDNGRATSDINKSLKENIIAIERYKQQAWDIIQKLDKKYLPKEEMQTNQQTEKKSLESNSDKPKEKSVLKMMNDGELDKAADKVLSVGGAK